jgi:hypothetical protein
MVLLGERQPGATPLESSPGFPSTPRMSGLTNGASVGAAPSSLVGQPPIALPTMASAFEWTESSKQGQLARQPLLLEGQPLVGSSRTASAVAAVIGVRHR